MLTFWNERRAISFNTTHLKLPAPRYLSTSTFVRFPFSPLPRCSLFCFPPSSPSPLVLLMAHYLQTNITRRIPNFPLLRSSPLSLPRLSFASEGEDTYKVQYRYPYRDIPNIVVSISSVARRGMPVWTLRETRVVRRCDSRYIPRVIYSKSFWLAEKAQPDKSRNKRTILKPLLNAY